MNYNQYYGNLIWTNHAIKRMRERGLSQEAAWDAFRKPDTTEKVKNEATKFQKRFGAILVSIVAKQNEKREWVIISCWADPPLPGSPDAKKQEQYWKYQRASGWKKWWLAFKKQIGF